MFHYESAGGIGRVKQNFVFKKETVPSETLFPLIKRFSSPSTTSIPIPIFFFQEEKMLAILVRHEVRSGVSGNVGMEVDGLPFHGTHAQMIQKLVDVTTMCV